MNQRVLQNNLVEEEDIQKAPLTAREEPSAVKKLFNPKKFADIRMKCGMKQIPNEFGSKTEGKTFKVPGDLEDNLWGEISRLRYKELLED